MRRFTFLIFALGVTGCATTPSSQIALRACYPFASDKSWPVHPQHFFDGEIHLVPSFTATRKGDKVPNYMTGYAVVFVKPGSLYQKMGFVNGDVITGFDDKDIDQSVGPDIFNRIKEGNYKNIKIDRCLSIRN